jgi:mono/diheme cytochrome c family protein
MTLFHSEARWAGSSVNAALRCLWVGGLVAATLGLTGCAIEVENVQAKQELDRLARPPGSVYTGWRVFQDRCAGCHGPAGAGTEKGPNLLPRVRELGPRRFVSLVLQRYEWPVPPQVRSDGAAGGAAIDDILQRRQGALAMPAWQGEPRVTAHIADLYAYLSARAEGTQGPGRPEP